MRLLRTELLRFWGRRITWITLGVISVIMVGSIGIAFTQTDGAEPLGDGPAIRFDENCVSDLAAMRDRGDPEFEGLSDAEIGAQYCTFFTDDGDRRFFATEMVGFGNVTDWDTHRTELDRTSTVVVDGEQLRSSRSGFEGILPAIGVFLLITAVVLGGSFVGAEYRAGTVENLLLWEPRRLRVMATKYAAGFVSSWVVMVLALGVLTLLLILLALVNGTFEGASGRFWMDLVLVLVRAGLMGGCFFILAMAIATVARNTTAAVAVLLGWFVVSNILVELLASRVRQYELFTNAAAFIGLGEVARVVGLQQQRVFAHGPMTAGLIVAIWTFVPGLLAAWWFRRRDVS